MKRREFITLLRSTAVTWSLAARAQPERMRRIAVMIALPEDDPELQKWEAALRQGLEKLGPLIPQYRHKARDVRIYPRNRALISGVGPSAEAKADICSILRRIAPDCDDADSFRPRSLILTYVND
jgi:hypothetical protein